METEIVPIQDIVTIAITTSLPSYYRLIPSASLHFPLNGISWAAVHGRILMPLQSQSVTDHPWQSGDKERRPSNCKADFEQILNSQRQRNNSFVKLPRTYLLFNLLKTLFVSISATFYSLPPHPPKAPCCTEQATQQHM